MIPLVGIVGRAGAGKTTLAEKLIAELGRRGYRVAAIKHSAHAVETPSPAKDSQRLAAAGAAGVIAVAPDRLLVELSGPTEWTPAEMAARLLPAVDLVLVEGFSQAAMPRIGVLRRGVAEDLPTRRGLIAVVTDMPADSPCPSYSFEQIEELAHLLESIIRRRPRRELFLFVNDRAVFIKPFVKDFILQPVAAMVSVLKGTENPARIQIVVDHPGGERPGEEENSSLSADGEE